MGSEFELRISLALLKIRDEGNDHGLIKVDHDFLSFRNQLRSHLGEIRCKVGNDLMGLRIHIKRCDFMKVFYDLLFAVGKRLDMCTDDIDVFADNGTAQV